MMEAMHTDITTVYGIRNCDTVKRARQWLTEHQVAHVFHDFKPQGVPPAELDHWLAALGWETLLNRKGTAWRKLDDASRAAVHDAAGARACMLAATSVIKRPVVAWPAALGGGTTVGFHPDAWARRLGPGTG
jgi:arsenate reductase (glutaredoxin)